jgi:hypothetical protein
VACGDFDKAEDERCNNNEKIPIKPIFVTYLVYDSVIKQVELSEGILEELRLGDEEQSCHT